MSVERRSLQDGDKIQPVLPVGFWKTVREVTEPFDLMNFTLTYDGDLPASANKPKATHVSRIRDVFHDQLADLWDSHIVLRQLARTARTHNIVGGGFFGGGPVIYSAETLPDYSDPIPPLQPGQTDFCASIKVPNSASYIPLIRKSLNLACSVDILFLRHEDPGALVFNGGDIDGRIKTLFDALRMPSEQEERVGGPPTADPLYCLLQSDTLISDLSVKTGRLLGEKTKKPHHVRLTIDVAVKVLRVMPENQCLIGG